MKVKTFKYIIDGQHKQFAISDVFSSIKEVKAELKNTSFSVPAYIEEINKLFKSKKSYFISRLENYSRSLSSNKEWLQNPIIPDHLSSLGGQDFTNLFISIKQSGIEREQRKLEKIITVLQKIIEKSELKDIAEFYKLEKDYIEPLAFLYERYDSPFLPIIQTLSEQTQLKDLLFQLRKKLKFLLRFKYTKVCRDLRQSFRNIIRFLFKNMSDESSVDDFLLQVSYQQKTLTFLNLKTHDFRRNCRTIKSFT